MPWRETPRRIWHRRPTSPARRPTTSRRTFPSAKTPSATTSSRTTHHSEGPSEWTLQPSEHNTYQAPLFGSFLGGPASGGFEATGTATAYSTGANYDHVFSPTLFTEVRFGVAHLRNSAQQTDYGSDDATTLGIPGNGPNGTDNVTTSSGQVAFQLSNFAGNGQLARQSAHRLLAVAALAARGVQYRLRQQLDQDHWQSRTQGWRRHPPRSR